MKVILKSALMPEPLVMTDTGFVGTDVYEPMFVIDTAVMSPAPPTVSTVISTGIE